MDRDIKGELDKPKRAIAAMPLLKSLANINRLTILCSLIDKEMNVNEIEKTLGIRQPTLSQQLSHLRENKLVKTRRDGKEIFYAIDSQEAEQVIEVLHGLYN